MLPQPGAADGGGGDGGGYKRKKSERSQAIVLVGLLGEDRVVVDTELIRVNFVREESEPRLRAGDEGKRGKVEAALRFNDCVRL